MGYDAIITINNEGLVMTFGLIDSRKVDMTHTDNLITPISINYSFLMRVLVNPMADVSILYGEFFQEMRLLSSKLNPPLLTLKFLDHNLTLVLGTIQVLVNIDNEDEGYINLE